VPVNFPMPPELLQALDAERSRGVGLLARQCSSTSRATRGGAAEHRRRAVPSRLGWSSVRNEAEK
jgi:hypothetical protein